MTASCPPAGSGCATVFTGLSAGTELSCLKGTNPFLRAGTSTPSSALFSPREPASPYPVTQGRHMETGPCRREPTAALPLGTRSRGRTGTATGTSPTRCPEPSSRCRTTSTRSSVCYVAHMGPICANGAAARRRDAGRRRRCRSLADGVAGRRVLVVGAGVVGLLTSLLARQHGAAEVVVVDATPSGSRSPRRSG